MVHGYCTHEGSPCTRIRDALCPFIRIHAATRMFWDVRRASAPAQDPKMRRLWRKRSIRPIQSRGAPAGLSLPAASIAICHVGPEAQFLKQQGANLPSLAHPPVSRASCVRSASTVVKDGQRGEPVGRSPAGRSSSTLRTTPAQPVSHGDVLCGPSQRDLVHVGAWTGPESEEGDLSARSGPASRAELPPWSL